MNEKRQIKTCKPQFLRLIVNLLLLVCIFSPKEIAAQTASQKLVSLNLKNSTFSQVISVLRQQTKYDFVYNTDDVAILKNITISVEKAKFEDALKLILNQKSTGLIYEFDKNTVIIKKKKITATVTQHGPIEVFGKVVDEKGKPVSWATIQILNTALGCNSDENGDFRIKNVGYSENLSIMASFVGMENTKVQVVPGIALQIVMKAQEKELGEVVVTGIFEREKKNFTGSSRTFTSSDLKVVGNQNVLASLKTLDPNFAIIENNTFGSDPNHLPDIEIRGKTSIIGLNQEFSTDPNQPLFILDGFESSLSVISDLSMDRVESITLLKDASATAIYGSKAANGVVVVETKRPKTGKLAINYNANLKFGYADLSAYNLMDSREKLEFEKLSGEYGAVDQKGNLTDEGKNTLYYSRLAEIARGVDTYWLSEPLRFAVTQNHSLFADGGDDRMRYGIGMSYGDNQGVMKGSSRQTINGNIRLIYRWKSLSFTEYFNIDNTATTREMVPFSNFARTNPYYRKYDPNGDVYKILESARSASGTTNIYNPLYNFEQNNFDNTSGINFRNNFEAEWRALEELKVRGRFSISKGVSKQETFFSPFNTRFAEMEQSKKGTFSQKRSDNLSYDGDISVTYGKLFAEKYMFNAVAGLRLSSQESGFDGFSVTGFADDTKPNPSFSNGYTVNSNPSYGISKTRSASYYLNSGFSYNSKYMVDISVRSDGSSIFGVDNKFTGTWSIGLGWNICEEQFMKNISWLSLLKLRGSIGNPGNQNFDAGMIYNTYTYNSSYQSLFGLSSFISSYGNKNLEWQKTLDRNIGLDVEMFNRRLRLNFDVYRKTTDPLLVYINVPSSTGINIIPNNLGSSISQGWSFSANYYLIKQKDLNWQVNAHGRYNNSKYADIGNSLDKYNQNNIASRSLSRFHDNGSATDLWAVRSAGIDPASGREIFIKKDGTQTFKFDYNDEVIVGNSTPDLDGIVGTSIYYKRFSFSMNIRYRFGGETFLKALFDKVENISSASVRYNQDKRALYDRWQKPGDIAKYKAISLTESTQMSSRFVVTENTLSGESISLGYDGVSKSLNMIGISSVSCRLYLNDIFRFSSVKDERGIDYPFERSISFSVGLRF